MKYLYQLKSTSCNTNSSPLNLWQAGETLKRELVCHGSKNKQTSFHTRSFGKVHFQKRPGAWPLEQTRSLWLCLLDQKHSTPCADKQQPLWAFQADKRTIRDHKEIIDSRWAGKLYSFAVSVSATPQAWQVNNLCAYNSLAVYFPPKHYNSIAWKPWTTLQAYNVPDA